MAELDGKLATKIVATLVDEKYFHDDCNLHYLEGHDGRRQHQAVCQANFDEDVHLVFNLPTVTKNVYLTVTDGPVPIVRRVLAALEDQEQGGGLKLGNVMLIDDAALKVNEICGVLLLPGSVFNVLDSVPDTIAFNADEYRVLGVIFLTESEHDIWKTRGHDALIAHFEGSEKDLISFGHDKSVGTS